MAVYEPSGPMTGGDWFQQNPYTPAPGGYGTPGAPIPGGPPQDYASAQAAFHQLFPGETLTPEMLKAHEAELNALGFQLRPNAAGQVGKIQWGNEPIVDVIQGAGSGLNRKQWLAGAPAGAPGAIGAGLENTPGYQFRLGEGLKALERSAASRGTLLTGGTLKGLERFGQNYASNEYGQRVGQLQNLAQLGYGAAGQQAGLGSTYAGQAGTLLGNQAGQAADLATQMGNAQAGGTLAGSQAWQQGLGGVGNLAQMYYLSRLMQPPMVGTAATSPAAGRVPLSGLRGAPLTAGNPSLPSFLGWG